MSSACINQSVIPLPQANVESISWGQAKNRIGKDFVDAGDEMAVSFIKPEEEAIAVIEVEQTSPIEQPMPSGGDLCRPLQITTQLSATIDAEQVPKTYREKIADLISTRWYPPRNLHQTRCMLRVRQTVKGCVSHVQFENCATNKHLRRSLENAILRAQPFPMITTEQASALDYQIEFRYDGYKFATN